MNNKPANGAKADLGPMKALAVVSRQLPAAGIDCVLIGGFAVNYYGYARNTLDVDFMIAAPQLDHVRQIMKREGFVNVIVNKNVAFFNLPGSPWRADFLFVDEGTMDKLLANAKLVKVHGFPIKIPALRDLLAMKIFALSQDVGRRRGKDLPDIAHLSVINHLDLAAEIRPLCRRFGTPGMFNMIRRQVEALSKP